VVLDMIQCSVPMVTMAWESSYGAQALLKQMAARNEHAANSMAGLVPYGQWSGSHPVSPECDVELAVAMAAPAIAVHLARAIVATHGGATPAAPAATTSPPSPSATAASPGKRLDHLSCPSALVEALNEASVSGATGSDSFEASAQAADAQT